MAGNRRFIDWTWAAFLVLSSAYTAPAFAAKIADETESPALRKPLPALVAPVASEEDAVFSTEAPPPPPFDPNYRPPASVKEKTP